MTDIDSFVICVVIHRCLLMFCAAVCGGAGGPQVSTPLGTAGNGWICYTDDHRPRPSGTQMRPHSHHFSTDVNIYLKFCTFIGPAGVDVLREHCSHLRVRGVL